MSSNWPWEKKFAYEEFNKGMLKAEYTMCSLLILINILILANIRLSMDLEVEHAKFQYFQTIKK